MSTRTFSAFLSYSHDDNEQEDRMWAQWLQEQLEAYVIPVELVGQENDKKELIPKSLHPIFRDRKELRTTTEGKVQIDLALANSNALIVICSPRSAQKEWVGNEILSWQKTPRAFRVFPVLIDGDPRKDAFPPPLDPGITIGADFRPGGRAEQGCTTPAAYRKLLVRQDTFSRREIDRRVKEFEDRLADEMLRLVAGLLDISPGFLKDRDAVRRAALAEKRTKEVRSALLIMAALLFAFILAGAFGLKKMQAEKEAETAAAGERERRVQVEAAARERTLELEVAAAKEREESAQELRRVEVQKQQVEARAAASTALSLADTLIEKKRPQDALARLADTCRRYPEESLATSRLLSLLTTRDWPLPVTGPVYQDTAQPMKGDPIERLRFSPDGRFIVASRYTGLAGMAEVWDVSTRQRIGEPVPCGSQGLEGIKLSPLPDEASFSPDGRYFTVAVPAHQCVVETADPATGGGNASREPEGPEPQFRNMPSMVTLLNLTTGKQTGRPVPAQVSALRFSPDSLSFLTGLANGEILEWDLDLKSKQRCKFKGTVAAISEDCQTALVVGDHVQLSPVDPKKPPRSVKLGPQGSVLGFTPKLDVVTVCTNLEAYSESSKLWTWRQKPTQELPAFREFIVDFQPYFALTKANASTLLLGKLRDDRRRMERTGLMPLEESGGVFHEEVETDPQDGFHPYDARRSRDGKWLTSVGSDQTARLWTTAGSQFQEPLIIQAKYECSSVDLSDDARRWLVADDFQGSWRIWSVDSTIAPSSKSEVTTLINSTHPMKTTGSVVVFGEGATSSAYDLVAGKAVPTPPDSALIAVEDRYTPECNAGGTHKLVPTDHGHETSLIDAPSGKVLQDRMPTRNGFARFSPDGKLFLTVSDWITGRFMQLWNTATGARLGATIPAPSKAAGFSANSNHAWSISFNDELSIFEVNSHRQIFGPMKLAGIRWAWVDDKTAYVVAVQAGRDDHERVVIDRLSFVIPRAHSLMCDLAEAISSRRVSPDGAIELWPASRETFVKLAQAVQMEQGHDPFLDWARWLLLDRDSELGNQLLQQPQK